MNISNTLSADEQAGIEKMKRAVREKAMKRYYDILPPRVAGFIKTMPREVIKIPLGSYYIYGPAGNGKTIYAARILIEGMQKHFDNRGAHKSAEFVTEGQFIQQINGAVSTNNNMWMILEKYQHCDFLIFDDIGTIKITDHAYQMLLLLVNHRYDHLLPTIFTSNYTLKELEKILDERIVSRIDRMCDFTIEKKHWKGGEL